MKVAIVLSGVAPAMTLMSGAMLEFAERDVEFDVISTSGVGALIGLLYVAPGGDKSRKEALSHLPDLFLSDLMARFMPVNFKVFHKHGPFSEHFRDWGKNLRRFEVDGQDSAPGKRFYNDLLDLWITALTPSTLNTKSKGLMTPLPLVDDLVDFDALKKTPGEFYLNAFNAATRRLKIFTKDELEADEYAAAQAMGFLYPTQRFGNDVYTIGATHDPTGLQAIWMHPDKSTRPDVIICLDAMRYAYWRRPTNIYDAFQLMLLNPVLALQRNIYGFYATNEWIYNQNRPKFGTNEDLPHGLPRLYRIPMEQVIKKEQYTRLLDWSHASAVEFEKVGREAAAPVADALCEALAGGNGAALEAFRFRRSASFAHDYGSWHCGTDAEGGHNHGLISGLERTLQTAVNDSLRAGRRKSATSQTSGASRPSGSGAAGATAGAGRPAAAVRKKVVKKKVAKKKAGKKRGPGA